MKPFPVLIFSRPPTGWLAPAAALVLALLPGCSTSSSPELRLNHSGPVGRTTGAAEAPAGIDFALSPSDKIRIQVLPVTSPKNNYVIEPNDTVKYEIILAGGVYHLLPGDELNVRFGADPKLELQLIVRPDGRITVGNGLELVATGKTPLQLTADIDAAYSERLNKPAASVNLTKTNLSRVELAGEAVVQTDGTVSIPRLGSFRATGIEPKALAQEISQKASAHFNVPLQVQVTRTPAAVGAGILGFDQILTISPEGMIALPEIGIVSAGGRTATAVQAELQTTLGQRYPNPLNVLVALESSESRVVYVDGEIARPGSYPLAPTMTLWKALAVAGGARETANLRSIIVLRRDRSNDVTVFVKDLGVINENLKENDMFLLPQDMIVVPMSGIAKMNLWMDQYIARMLPFSRNVSYSYNQGETALNPR